MRNSFCIDIEIPLNNYPRYLDNERYKNTIRIKELPSRKQKIQGELFNTSHYVEWLIECKNISANGDLANMFYQYVENDIISSNEIDALLTFMNNPIFFYEDILLNEQGQCYQKNNFTYFIKYPSIIHNFDKFWLEISFEPRGYAKGFQAMFYICTFISNLKSNQLPLLNRQTYSKEQAYLTFDLNDKLFVLEAFKIFGILSPSHNYDIRQILEWIRANLNHKEF